MKLRLNNLQKAFARLTFSKATLEKTFKNGEHNKDEILLYQDSVIQRFEFCFELLWKTLKDVLEYQHGIVATSPKKIFHECLAVDITNEEETAALLDMSESRNLTTHDYNASMAQEISNKICLTYYRTMQTIINRLAI